MAAGWFDLALGIRVDGENIPLVAAARRPCFGRTRAGWRRAATAYRRQRNDHARGDGVRYRIAAARIPIVATLVDLFSAPVWLATACACRGWRRRSSIRWPTCSAGSSAATIPCASWRSGYQGKQQLPQVPPPAAAGGIAPLSAAGAELG